MKPQRFLGPRDRVLGLLAGGDLAPAVLARWAASATCVLAADSGAERAKEAGFLPHWTMGDLDSVSPETRRMLTNVIPIADPDRRDVEKLIDFAVEAGATAITLAGVEGDALDHVFGNVLAAANAPVPVRFVLRRGMGWVLRGPVDWQQELPAGARVSVVPLSPCRGVTIQGTQWTLDDAELEPQGLTSISNRSLGRPRVTLHHGHALVTVEREPLPIWDNEGGGDGTPFRP